MHKAEFDKKDEQILNLLSENARFTYQEMASRVGLSRIAVKNRILNMEKSGIIKGYKVVTDLKSSSNCIRFIVNVSPKAENYDYVLGILGKSDLITQLYAVTGDCRIMAFGLAASEDAMDAFYLKLRKIFTDVHFFSFDIIASTYKDVDGGIIYDRKEIAAADAGKTDFGYE